MMEYTKRDGWLESYDQIKNNTIKERLRGGLLSAMHTLMKGTGVLQSNRPRVQFIFAHHVLRGEVDGFRCIVERIAEEYNVVSYSEAVRRVHEGPIDEPLICFSFDDGLKDHLRIGRILAEYGISACFFVCPGIVGTQDPETLRAFADRLGLPVSPVLSWEDIDELQSLGHEIGGHTFTHRNLGEISHQRVRDEVHKTFDVLEARSESSIHFAWPYGKFSDIDASAVQEIFRAGFSSCASAVRGCHVHPHGGDSESLCIRRDVFVAGKPLRNVEVFLALNTLLTSRQKNEWPPELNANKRRRTA
jgi:peptidoglycan/xylan/chitin deacetylase (PgdA/CDA1 family)